MKLRKLMMKDAEKMLEWMHDEDVTKDLRRDFASKTLDDVLAFIEYANTTNDEVHMAIVDDNDVYMGTASLKSINNERQDAELNRKIEKEREKEYQKLNMSIENISVFTEGLNKDVIKENVENKSLNLHLNDKNIDNIDVIDKVEKVSKEVIPPSEAEYKVEKIGNFLEETIKLEVEKNLDEQIKKIETEIKLEEEKNIQENNVNVQNGNNIESYGIQKMV